MINIATSLCIALAGITFLSFATACKKKIPVATTPPRLRHPRRRPRPGRSRADHAILRGAKRDRARAIGPASLDGRARVECRHRTRHRDGVRRGYSARVLAFGIGGLPSTRHRPRRDCRCHRHGQRDGTAASSPTTGTRESDEDAGGADHGRGPGRVFRLRQCDVRNDARAALTSGRARVQNRSSRRNPNGIVIVVEGHCDERGSAEYNLRAGRPAREAAPNYLIQLGVPADRLRASSATARNGRNAPKRTNRAGSATGGHTSRREPRTPPRCRIRNARAGPSFVARRLISGVGTLGKLESG